MNKQCYRVVFNKARGMMMVVSEVTKSQNKKAGNSSGKKSSSAKSGTHSGINVSYHRLILAILCCQSMIYTQVQAATSAIQNTASNVPVNQRAALLKATNGTPIVNIRTPNSKGLSHNTYNQFDIGSNGVILNNSMGSANTHLAGNIAGNQYLAQGVANTILNEVRSNAPVKFQGNLEVGGQRADVIIASPSGLQIQGGGFINANRTTLTTGTPKIDSAGNLTGFDVKQGQIQFDNNTTSNALGGDLYDGKNKNQANYVDVLARAVTINGQIHANQDVNMVIGSNTVDYDTGSATKITGTGTAPTLAVDVSTLGGIYANSINLIGTENGLGVRNAGNIKATQQIVLTNSGKIENAGTIQTTKAQTSLVSINATGTTGSIEHSGNISSYGMIDMQADKDITLNKGIVRKNSTGTVAQLMPNIIRVDAGGSLKVSNSSDVRNITVDDQANIYLHSGVDTTVDSKSIVASNGGVSIEADRYAQLTDTSTISAANAAITVSSKSGTTIDNATVTGRGEVYINSKTADTTVGNNSKLSAQKSLVIGAGRDATLKTGSRILAANDLTIAATRNATVDTAGSIKVTNDAAVQAGELAYLKDSTQPITIGKQLTIEGKQATVLNSTANADDGIYITSQGKATTITNSTLNSTKGAVTAIANQAALNVNKLTTDANSTVLAAGSNVGITASNLKADNIVIESGATTTINGLTTAAKDMTQIVGISITSKENTNVSDSTLDSTGNTVMRSDLGITLSNSKVDSQNLFLKTNKGSIAAAQGIILIKNTELSATKDKIKLPATDTAVNNITIDAASYVSMIDAKTASTGNIAIKSTNSTLLKNSQINAGKNLVINSGNLAASNGLEVGTNGLPKNKIHADEIVSIDSKSDQQYNGTSITGGAVILKAGSSIGFNGNTSINATGNTKLATSKEKLIDGKAINTLNGDLAIGSGVGSLTIDPKNITLNAIGDMSLAARGGKLHLKGYAGTQGLGSEKIVKLTTAGDINLSGKSVLIEGSDLDSSEPYTYTRRSTFGGTKTYIGYRPSGEINVTATDGSVELKGVKNSFTNSVSQYKINTINYEIANAQAELNQAFSDTKWVEEYNKQKADWMNFVISSCYNSGYPGGMGQCIQIRSVDMNAAARIKPEYVKVTKSANYQDYMSFLSRQETLRGTLSDLTQVLATSQKASTGFEHKAASLTAGKDINITAKQGVLIEGADITSSNGGISILAEGNLAATTIVGTDPTTNISKTYLNNDSIRITGLADIYQQGNISKGVITGPNYSYHQLVNQPKLTAKGDIKISAQGKLAKASDTYNTTSKTYTTNNAVILNSADIISTGGNVRIDAALGGINLEASQAAFMDGSQTTTTKRKWYGKKKTTTTTKTSNNSNAVTTDIQANNISLIADGNINIYGSDLTAAPTGNIKLTAGKLLNLYAVDDVNESSVDVKKKSSFLGVRYNKDHTNDTRQELSQLPATLIGGKAYTASGGSTLLQGTVFKTLKPADIKVGVGKYADDAAQVILAPITNQITTTHNQEKESTVWQKTVDQGSVVTTAQLPKFNQVPTITSPGGVTVAVPVDVTVDSNNKAKTNIQKSQEDLGRIALNLSKQPGYEYLAALDKTNDINWVQVDLIQKNWNYTQEGLTPGAAALIAIAVTIATSGAGGAAGMGATLTGTTGAMGAAATAAFSSLAAQASVTLINNKGDINKTLNQLASSATVRSMATAALTAGLTAKLNLPQMANNDFANKLVNGVAEGATGAFVNAAVNGVSLEDALKNSLRSSLVDVFAAETFSSFVKNIDTNDFADNLAHKLVAAGVGCVTASAKKQSCDAGALGAAVGEMFGDYLVDNPNALTDIQKQEIINAAKLLAGSIALLTNVDVNAAAEIAGTAVKNNSLKNIEDYCGSFSDCFEEFRKKGSISQRPTDIYKGDWQLIAVLDKQGKTIGYTAYNTKKKTTDFIVRTNEVQEFKNATPTLIENAVALFALTQMKPKYQYDAEVAIMNRDVNAFGQAWTDALSSPGYYLFVGANATGGVIAKNIGSKVYVYRKMSVVEANATKSSNRLQPSISGSNSSKYLSEDLAKVKAFSNKGVTEPQVIVRFELDPIQYNSMMAKAVNQNNSKGINAIKLNNEGITNPKLNNIGVPSGILNDFNRAIKPNGVKIYE